MKQRPHPRAEREGDPSPAEVLRLTDRVRKATIGAVTFRLLGPCYRRAIVAGMSCGLSGRSQSSSCTLLSVRDEYTIVLRLQCARTRCGRKGLAGRSNARLGHLFWDGKNLHA